MMIRLSMELSLIKLVVVGIWCEAVVELFFNGAPIQKLRSWLILKTPFLTFEGYGNIFNCKYCVSFYVGILGVFLYIYLNHVFFFCIGIAIVLHRISNYIHIMYRIVVDHQINLRLARNHKGNWISQQWK